MGEYAYKAGLFGGKILAVGLCGWLVFFGVVTCTFFGVVLKGHQKETEAHF